MAPDNEPLAADAVAPVSEASAFDQLMAATIKLPKPSRACGSF